MSNRDKFNPMTEDHLELRKALDSLPKEKLDERVLEIQSRSQIENCSSFYDLAKREEDPGLKLMLEQTINIAERVKKLGGIAMVVGGYTRDTIMAKFGTGKRSKDVDIEVYGVEPDILELELLEVGPVNTIGRSFGVFKVGDLDISVPRSDSKIGAGHKGFEIKGNPQMPMIEASRRRDFTINAMLLDPLTGEVIDYYGGIDDIRDKNIRVVDSEKFGDDPLRVLRAAQFAGRFGFGLDLETIKISRDTDITELPKERIGGEWMKLLLKSDRPSIGLEAMRWLGVIDKLHPELGALINVPQNPEYHPEGDVWTHIKKVADQAAVICFRENLNEDERKLIMLSALCHDLGKPEKTITDENGKIISHDHEDAGIEPTKRFLEGINIPKDLITKVCIVVQYHMRPLFMSEVTEKGVRKLSAQIAPISIKLLTLFSEADLMGLDQPTKGPEICKMAEVLSVAESKPKPIFNGKDLLELGAKPGRDMGEILRKLYEWQLSGHFISFKDGLRFAQLAKFVVESRNLNIDSVALLNGEVMTKDEMIDCVESRLTDEGIQDMGTLVMTLILLRRDLPKVLEKNKTAILTAHKYGPVWFPHLDKEFYETSWKSFYGKFESGGKDIARPLKDKSYLEQLEIGLDLIQTPKPSSIKLYERSFEIKPVDHSGFFALYNTEEYPFGAGMFDGYRIMVQFNSDKNRVSVSILYENTEKVAELDKMVRQLIPELAGAKKIGYLTADEKPDGTSFQFEDARDIYHRLASQLRI